MFCRLHKARTDKNLDSYITIVTIDGYSACNRMFSAVQYYCSMQCVRRETPWVAKIKCMPLRERVA